MRHVHASGRFDATPAELTKALDFYALVEKADVITLTEVAPKPLGAAILAWAKSNGWFFWHPGGRGPSECAILSRHRFDKRTAFRLSDITLKTGRTAPLYLTAAHIKGGPWIGVWHTPAHNGGLKPSLWATRVYRAALVGLRQARMRMRGGGVVLAADWNLDLRRSMIRAQLAKPYPAFRWALSVGQKPTLGGRVIDGVLTNLPVIRSAKTLPPQDGFDHRAVLTILGKKHPKPKPAPKPAPKPKPEQTTTVYPAIAAARKQSHDGPQFGVGECLMRVRMCYGIPAQQHDAAAAWRAAKVKHTRTPAPRGYPVFWTGGSHGYGHIAIATGDGNVWSTDIRRPGFFDLCPITEINARWGLTYAGWAEDVNGVAVQPSKEIRK